MIKYVHKTKGRLTMKNKVLLFSVKNKDLKFGIDFMCNWFGGNTKLSELKEDEVNYVHDLLFFKDEK